MFQEMHYLDLEQKREQKRKSVNSKPSERLGRKVTGLKGVGPMTAGSPDKAFTDRKATKCACVVLYLPVGQYGNAAGRAWDAFAVRVWLTGRKLAGISRNKQTITIFDG